MLKYSIAAVALVACSSLAVADQMDRGSQGAGSSNSAAEHAPGQLKGSGSAKEFAPGQTKEEGSSAKEQSPGHLKNSAEGSSKSGAEEKSRHSENEGMKGSEKSGSEKMQRSESSEGMKNSDTSRSADRDRDRDLKGKDIDKNAKGETSDRDRTKESRRDMEKGSSSTGTSAGTDGREGGKGSIASVTTEQRTRVKSVFMQHRVEPARNLNVSINVGVALPHTVHLYPIPQDIVEIVPEYRGYEYILLEDDRVAIVDPDTFEVVDIIVVA